MSYSRFDPPGRGAFHPDATMRVSDAERAVVADALKRHCGDGRLDVIEFEERLHLALTAKTRGDLAGLLDDLPNDPPGGPQAPPARTRRRPRLLALVLAAVVFVGVISVLSSLAAPHVPWLLVGLAVLWFSRRSRCAHRQTRRRDRHRWDTAA